MMTRHSGCKPGRIVVALEGPAGEGACQRLKTHQPQLALPAVTSQPQLAGSGAPQAVQPGVC